MLQVSAFIATSLDGFIAREDGAVDWLPDPTESDAADACGFSRFFDAVDCHHYYHHPHLVGTGGQAVCRKRTGYPAIASADPCLFRGAGAVAVQGSILWSVTGL